MSNLDHWMMVDLKRVFLHCAGTGALGALGTATLVERMEQAEAERDKLRDTLRRIDNAADQQDLMPYERWRVICQILEAERSDG